MNREINKKAIQKYGVAAQCNIAMEECAELIQAVSKIRRCNDSSTLVHLIEEMADVSIVIDQLMIMYGVTEEVLNLMIQYKQARNALRMEGVKI